MKHRSGPTVQTRVMARPLAGPALALLLALSGCAEPAFDPSELIEVRSQQRLSDDGDHIVHLVDEPAIPVFYRSSLDPDGFGARLNGEDITDAFEPVPGQRREVEIPQLTDGKHELVFEVRPLDARRTRQIKFIVERTDDLPFYPTHVKPYPAEPPTK